jgi:hypothetical protein
VQKAGEVAILGITHCFVSAPPALAAVWSAAGLLQGVG